MNAVNRDEVFLEWAARNPFLPGALLFQHLGDGAGSCAVMPVTGDGVVKLYIDGSKVVAYDFALQMLLPVSSAADPVNTDNMRLQRQWADWIEARERDGDYPDFGTQCGDYQLELVSGMPELAMLGENGMGKYQFFARLTYREDKNNGDK